MQRYIMPRSFNLKSAGYDKENEIMEIEFQDGSVYEYLGVPHSTYRRMRQARSQGRFFALYIKPAYHFVKLENRREP